MWTRREGEENERLEEDRDERCGSEGVKEYPREKEKERERESEVWNLIRRNGEKRQGPLKLKK